MNIRARPTHFELFGLPVSFRVDTAQLAACFRELQRTVHPDRFAAAADRDRRLAVEQAAQVNEAYQTLRDPRRRARYLLELHGVRLDDERDTTQDPEFLMEQMALRERIAGVRDEPDPLAALETVNDLIGERIQVLVSALEQLFEASDAQALAEAKQQAQRLQFFERLREEVLELEEELVGQL